MKQLVAATVLVLASTVTAFAQPGPEDSQATDTEDPTAQAAVSGQVTISGTVNVGPVAQPAPIAQPVAAQGAPISEPWSNVSHINGTLVPVGEKNQYLLEQKRKLNISTNPIGWMFGFYGVSASYALSNNIAIRGDVNVFSLDGTKGYEYGISLPIYFKRTYQGPFLEPGIIARGFSNTYDSSCYDCSSYDSNDDSMVGPEILFGWHWSFDSGLNVAAAFGAARNMNAKMDQYGSTTDEVTPAGYFRIGYAF